MFLAISTLVFLFFISSSSAADMSIISYDNNHDHSSSWRTDDEVMTIYQTWLAKRGKTSNGMGHNEKRFQIFKDNLRFIDEHNSLNRTYKVGLNKFADLTNEEYRAMYLGTRSDAKRRLMKSKVASQRYAFKAGDELPESVDWREKGAVNPVKDQGSCGNFLFPFLTCVPFIFLFFFCSILPIFSSFYGYYKKDGYIYIYIYLNWFYKVLFIIISWISKNKRKGNLWLIKYLFQSIKKKKVSISVKDYYWCFWAYRRGSGGGWQAADW